MISIGNLKQCNLFMSLINQSFYQNKKLDLNFYQNFNFEWKIFSEISYKYVLMPSKQKSIMSNLKFMHMPMQIMKPSDSHLNSIPNKILKNSEFSKLPYNCKKPQLFYPHFPSKIHKPSWNIHKPFQSLSTSKGKLKNMNRYFTSNEAGFSSNFMNKNNFPYGEAFVKKKNFFTLNKNKKEIMIFKIK